MGNGACTLFLAVRITGAVFDMQEHERHVEGDAEPIACARHDLSKRHHILIPRCRPELSEPIAGFL